MSSRLATEFASPSIPIPESLQKLRDQNLNRNEGTANEIYVEAIIHPLCLDARGMCGLRAGAVNNKASSPPRSSSTQSRYFQNIGLRGSGYTHGRHQTNCRGGQGEHSRCTARRK